MSADINAIAGLHSGKWNIASLADVATSTILDSCSSVHTLTHVLTHLRRTLTKANLSQYSIIILHLNVFKCCNIAIYLLIYGCFSLLNYSECSINT